MTRLPFSMRFKYAGDTPRSFAASVCLMFRASRSPRSFSPTLAFSAFSFIAISGPALRARRLLRSSNCASAFTDLQSAFSEKISRDPKAPGAPPGRRFASFRHSNSLIRQGVLGLHGLESKGAGGLSNSIHPVYRHLDREVENPATPERAGTTRACNPPGRVRPDVTPVG